MRIFSFFVLAALSAGAHASEPKAAVTLVSCATVAGPWNAEVRLDDEGKGSLELAAGGRHHRCELHVEEFDSLPSARVPQLSLLFSRGSCVPALDRDAEASLSRSIPVNLTRASRSAAPTGFTQLLEQRPTTPCTVDAYHPMELEQAYRRWRARDAGK